MNPWQEEFPLDPGVHYLNHAAVAPWPRRTVEAVTRFATANLRHGARDYPLWQKQEERLREQLQRLIGATSAEDIALLKNTSEGLSVISEGLAWRGGETVLITDQEFPSNRIPWQALERYGVKTVEVSLESEDPEASLIEAIGRCRPRLLSVSSVQYGTGLRLDLARLGRACAAAGVLFCVDAIQSLGALPLDVEDIRADFVVADGHKWMLGPEGVALFWCRPEHRETLALHQYGWHMVERAGDYGQRHWTPARTARRFECGSPNMLGAHALSASLSLLEEVGVERIGELIATRISRLEEGLRERGMHLLTPTEPRRRAGIITFRPADGPLDECFEALRARGVVCALRGGGIRLSPHFHTPDRTLEQALEALD